MAVYKINESKKKVNEGMNSRMSLIDALDAVYSEIPESDTGWRMMEYSDLDKFFNDHGAKDDDSDPDEGFYASMTTDQLVSAYNDLRKLLLDFLNDHPGAKVSDEIVRRFNLKHRWESIKKKVNESVADPREYDLEDLMTPEEADRARQEADEELTRLMDQMDVRDDIARQHSRWSRVVDDIAYLVASCRRYDVEPYKYND